MYFDFVLSPSDRPPYIFKPWEGTTRSEECHWIQPSRLLQQRHLRPAQLPQSTSELCRWLCGRFDFCRLQPQTQDSHGMVLLLWLFSQQVLLWWCVVVLISSESSFVDSWHIHSHCPRVEKLEFLQTPISKTLEEDEWLGNKLLCFGQVLISASAAVWGGAESGLLLSGCWLRWCSCCLVCWLVVWRCLN